MKDRKRKSILVSMLLIFTLILAACSGGNKTSGDSEKKSTGKPVQGGDLVIGSIAEPTLFNSLYSTDVASSDIEERIYSFYCKQMESLTHSWRWQKILKNPMTANSLM